MHTASWGNLTVKEYVLAYLYLEHVNSLDFNSCVMAMVQVSVLVHESSMHRYHLEHTAV